MWIQLNKHIFLSLGNRVDARTLGHYIQLLYIQLLYTIYNCCIYNCYTLYTTAIHYIQLLYTTYKYWLQLSLAVRGPALHGDNLNCQQSIFTQYLCLISFMVHYINVWYSWYHWYVIFMVGINDRQYTHA